MNRAWRNSKIVILWVVAIFLIVAQLFALREVTGENRAHARSATSFLIVPADWWRVCGVLVPLSLIGIALWLQRGWPSVMLRWLSTIGLIALVPTGIIAAMVALGGGPVTLGSVRLPSGTRFVLAIEPIPTDSVYTLYQPLGRWGFWWGQIAQLDYSEDGRFTGGEKIVLSPDNKWLLIARAGVWTDCFRLVEGRPLQCGTRTQPNWSDSRYERDMRARSVEIQQLTGFQPPHSN